MDVGQIDSTFARSLLIAFASADDAILVPTRCRIPARSGTPSPLVAHDATSDWRLRGRRTRNTVVLLVVSVHNGRFGDPSMRGA
jgi:hypothetical protein